MHLDELFRRLFYGRKKEQKEVASEQQLLEDPVLREVFATKLQKNTLLRLAIEIYQQISDMEETMQDIETADKVSDDELAEIDALIDSLEPLSQRRHPFAVTLSEVCYRISKRILRDEYRMALCLQALGETRLQLGKPQLALPPLQEAAQHFEDEEEWAKVVACYGNMGLAWRLQGDLDAAADFFQRAFDVARESGDELLLARTEQWIAEFAGGKVLHEE
jgi:tetratricopeptide (TPR) repeat protein